MTDELTIYCFATLPNLTENHSILPSVEVNGLFHCALWPHAHRVSFHLPACWQTAGLVLATHMFGFLGYGDAQPIPAYITGALQVSFPYEFFPSRRDMMFRISAALIGALGLLNLSRGEAIYASPLALRQV
jgi:hypothetical protein